MNLKIRILEYIFDHTCGVTIIDMEQPLGEKRMRLGYVTQSLLEEGKIRKVDDKYFPINENQEDQYFIKDIANIQK